MALQANVSDSQPIESPRILIMEDDAYLLRLYEKALTKAGFTVDTADTVGAARTLLHTHHYRVFLSDVHLGEEQGVNLLRQEIATLHREGTEIIVASGSAEYYYLTQEIDIDFFLEKPVAISALVSLVQQLVPLERM